MKNALTFLIVILAAGVLAQDVEREGRGRSERRPGGPEGRSEMGRMGDRSGGARGGERGERGGRGGEGGREEMLGRLLESEEARERLGMTEEDVTKLQAELHELKIAGIDLKAKMGKLALEQAKAWTGKEANEEEILRIAGELGDVRKQLGLLQTKKMLLVRKYIDPEKMKGLREQMRERMRRRQGEEGDRGPRMGGDREGGTRDGDGDSDMTQERRKRLEHMRKRRMDREKEQGEGDKDLEL